MKKTAIVIVAIIGAIFITANQRYMRRHMSEMKMRARHLPEVVDPAKLEEFGVTVEEENLEDDSKGDSEKDFPKVAPQLPSSSYCCLGRIEGTTTYCIFRYKEPIAAFDLGEEMTFTGTGGICLGKDTLTAYAIFYVSYPKFDMKIIKLNVENVENVASGAEISESELSEHDAKKYPWVIKSEEELQNEPDFSWFPILRKPSTDEYYFVIPLKEEWAKLLELHDDEYVSCTDFEDITVEVIPVQVH